MLPVNDGTKLTRGSVGLSTMSISCNMVAIRMRMHTQWLYLTVPDWLPGTRISLKTRYASCMHFVPESQVLVS